MPMSNPEIVIPYSSYRFKRLARRSTISVDRRMAKKNFDIITSLAKELERAGFLAVRGLSAVELKKRLAAFPEDAHRRPGLPEGGTVIVAAFPYTRPAEPEDLSTPGDPHALVAPFARRHYYREAVLRMKRAGAGAGLPTSQVRLFSNSRLPEKPIAAAAGLGFYGRNGLIITEETGSRFIIAGIMVPITTAGASHGPFAAEPGSHCGSCRRCVDACPAGALDGSGALDQAVCLQALSTEYRLLPEPTAAVWGKRLYGCDLCQDPCPFNASPRRDSPPITGELGPSLSIRRILALGLRGELKARLRGTALGLGWMDERAFLRNALVAAGRSMEAVRTEEFESYLTCDDPVLAETARRAKKAASGL